MVDAYCVDLEELKLRLEAELTQSIIAVLADFNGLSIDMDKSRWIRLSPCTRQSSIVWCAGALHDLKGEGDILLDLAEIDPQESDVLTRIRQLTAP
jgi:hypothetical protein